MTKIKSVLSFRAICTAIVVAFSPLANAVDISEVYPYLEFGLEFGGDELAEEAGGYGPVETNAGGGLNFTAGALLKLQGETLDGDFLIALGYLGNNGDEAEFSVTRLDLIYLFNDESSRHRFGIGPTIHFNPRLELDPEPVADCVIFCFDSPFPEGTTEFDDAVGLNLRYEYNLYPHYADGGGITLGVRYTVIEYQSDVDDVDASGIGVYVNIF